MFKSVRATWNPEVGCSHNCVYCWARRQAKRQKRRCALCYSFIPHLHLDRAIPGAERIFVSSMGDLFCDGVSDAWIESVLKIVRRHRDRDFLFCTKNPARYTEFLDSFTPNCILGVTIETSRDDLVKPLTKAPLPSARYDAMRELNYPRKFLSVEPVMDFDLDILLGWIKEIAPEICEIGYDNYRHQLPEPPLSKTMELIEEKGRLGIDTREKELRPAWWEEAVR